MKIAATFCLVFLAVFVRSLAKPSAKFQEGKPEYDSPAAGEAYSLTKSGVGVGDVWSNCSK